MVTLGVAIGSFGIKYFISRISLYSFFKPVANKF